MTTEIEMKGIRDAVLAECERLCPEVTDQFLSNFDLGLIGKFKDEDGYHWTLNSSTGAVFCCIYEHQNDAEFMRAYRLLGLEAKAKDAEIDQLRKLGESYITMLEFELESPEDEEAKFNLEVLLENAREALKGGTNGTN